ncbi:MAG: lytic transglycosylase domain-containing protein [Ottowia sp.]|nr:lytic transglycosylase domain-containing protein [Ottowia sp.]
MPVNAKCIGLVAVTLLLLSPLVRANPTTLEALLLRCAPDVHPRTMARIVSIESGANPFAIGVVGAKLVRQPKSLEEAVATAMALEQAGWNFDMGLAQINKQHVKKFGLDFKRMFDACTNVHVGAKILSECYGRAKRHYPTEQASLHAALSCYNSGNFKTGVRLGYVNKFLQAGEKVLLRPIDKKQIVMQGGGV